MLLLNKNTKKIIKYAIKEDLGKGDITSRALVRKGKKNIAKIIFKQDAVFVGQDIIKYIYKKLNRKLNINMIKKDGDWIKKGEVVCEIAGDAYSILIGERLVLNFLQRFSGIATTTKKYVDAVSRTGVKILDTRKTTPGMRQLDRYAVRMGGGHNHRFGLFDQVLIKENHLKAFGGDGLDVLKKAVLKAKNHVQNKCLVEIEAETKDEVMVLETSGADIIMFDNMSIEDMTYCMENFEGDKKPLWEASGNITLDNVRQVAKCGVDRISIGALTHSYTSVDISLCII